MNLDVRKFLQGWSQNISRHDRWRAIW